MKIKNLFFGVYTLSGVIGFFKMTMFENQNPSKEVELQEFVLNIKNKKELNGIKNDEQLVRVPFRDKIIFATQETATKC